MSVMAGIKKFRRKLNIRFFRNHIGLYYNFLHYLYLLLSRKNFTKEASDTLSAKFAAELRQKGYFVLPPDEGSAAELVKKIGAEANLCFSRDKVVKTFDEGGMHRLAECVVQLPELEKVLLQPRIAKQVSAYYQAHFKVYSCDVYRTFPQKKETIESFIWHIDNAPRDTLKVMIYLTDVTEKNGALSLLPKEPTRKLQLAGLIDRTDAASFESEILAGAQTVTGPAGTIILFAAQDCLHRGSYVQENYRDVATFLVFPSPKPQEPFSEADRMVYSKNFGYLLNPFTGKALRSGDE